MTCPHCGNDDPKMLELLGLIIPKQGPGKDRYRCEVCSKEFLIIKK